MEDQNENNFNFDELAVYSDEENNTYDHTVYQDNSEDEESNSVELEIISTTCPICRQPEGDIIFGVSSPNSDNNNDEASAADILHFQEGDPGSVAGVQEPYPESDPYHDDNNTNNHWDYLQSYASYNFTNSTNQPMTYHTTIPSCPSSNTIYDYINNINNNDSNPRLEIRNQEIIFRNIPFNEMIEVHRFNPNREWTEIENTTTNLNSLRRVLNNLIDSQLNNIENNNRLNVSIFNQ